MPGEPAQATKEQQMHLSRHLERVLKTSLRGAVAGMVVIACGAVVVGPASSESLRDWLRKQKNQDTGNQASAEEPSFGSGNRKLLKSQQPLTQPAQTNFNGGAYAAKSTTDTEIVVDKGVRPMLAPDSPMALQNAISRYQSIVAAGGWGTVPSSKLAKGSQGQDVAVLKRRMVAEGYLPESTLEGEKGVTFTTALEQAVRQFQTNHGLAPTGRLDKPTVTALNVPAGKRLATLRANLPRVAEYSKDLGPRYITVNVPALQLEAVQNGRVFSRHNVIAGKPERPSPIVMTRLSDINFNPYWNVPVSIVERDLIPQILKGGTQTLRKQNIRIYDGFQGPEVDPDDVDWSSTPPERYFFRQDPGKDNAMATVKINFPSPFGVYMHDTPLRNLFGTAGRYLSSGCVRVEQVPILVNWILNGQDGWNQGRIAEMAQSLERLDVKLVDPPQLRWVYLTAWVNAAGQANFRDDIYDLDGSGFIVGQPMPVGEYSDDGQRFVLKPIPRAPTASPVDSLGDDNFGLFDSPKAKPKAASRPALFRAANWEDTSGRPPERTAPILTAKKTAARTATKVPISSAFARLQKGAQSNPASTAHEDDREQPKAIKKKKKAVQAAAQVKPEKTAQVKPEKIVVDDNEPLFGQD
jgi:peptidoglycan hydrolase-like protein with peptidoglycan-binding domain